MFTNIVIWPYKLGSTSARDLAQALHVTRVRTQGRYTPRDGDLIINWGSSTIPNWWGGRAIRATYNLPQYVQNAADKTAAFRVLDRAGLPVVASTTNIAEARAWLNTPIYGHNTINAVVCRQLTRANSGRGIVLARTPDELVPAPLYTRYRPKAKEFRIHVWGNQAIDAQEKRKVNGFAERPGTNTYIRNHPFGWVFCRENLEVPPEVSQAAVQAVAALNLHFGAVDLGWHGTHGIGIYEVNTAPGIEGQTLTNYANAIRGELRRRHV